MSILIAYPWLALIPAAALVALYRASRRTVVLAAAGAWLAYAGYELAMKSRWLCSGECNIRVDLLAIYPVLLILTGYAAWHGIRRRPRPPR